MEEMLKHKNLIMRLSIDLHAETKIMATKKNQTISTYVRRAIFEALKKDKKNGL